MRLSSSVAAVAAEHSSAVSEHTFSIPPAQEPRKKMFLDDALGEEVCV